MTRPLDQGTKQKNDACKSSGESDYTVSEGRVHDGSNTLLRLGDDRQGDSHPNAFLFETIWRIVSAYLPPERIGWLVAICGYKLRRRSGNKPLFGRGRDSVDQGKASVIERDKISFIFTCTMSSIQCSNLKKQNAEDWNGRLRHRTQVDPHSIHPSTVDVHPSQPRPALPDCVPALPATVLGPTPSAREQT